MTKWLMILALAATAAAAADDSLYGRVAAKLAADPALAKSLDGPPAELKALDWLAGAWRVTATVTAGARPAKPEIGASQVSRVLGGAWIEIRDTYPKGTQDLGFLTYDRAQRRWTSLALDSLGNCVETHAAAWHDGALTMEGDATILGVHAHLRQTLRKIGARAYTVTNEERGADGRWRVLDIYRYTRTG